MEVKGSTEEEVGKRKVGNGEIANIEIRKWDGFLAQPD